MTDAPKLKPCPFCGNADELLYGFGGRIFCDECGCEGPFSHFFKGDWNTRADLIDMDVLRRVEAGYSKALTEAESWIHDQLDGTGHVEDALADLDESRSALTGLRAMMEKLK